MAISTVSAGTSQTITSGQTSNTIIVASGGILTVLSGGVAIGTAVSGQELLSGGTDLSGVIASTGRQTVYSGGIASGTVISGVEIVSSGGVASAITVYNGNLPAVTIQAGGRVIDATIAAGGYIAVRGLTSATYNAAFGTTSFTVEQTASASDTIVQPGGTLEEAGGGVATGTVLLAGMAPSGNLPATEYVDAAATTYGTVVEAGAEQVATGGLIVASATILGKGGTSVGAALGSAVNTTVAFGGAIDINGGGIGIGTVLLGPGDPAFPGPATEYVYAGGEAIGTTVSSGTVDNVYGTAVNAVVADGGRVYDSGTVSYDEAAGAAMTFAGVLTGGGNLVQSGPGSLTLTGDLAGYAGNISISGGTLEMATPLLGATSITFQAAAPGRLQIDAQTAPAATISGFAIGDVIDLRALGYDGFATPAVNGTAVTVTEGGLSESLTIAGASFRSFRLSDDGSGGTNLQVACYCAGTLILTDRGEVPVETLAIGDLVITLSGAAEPVRWIGRRSYAGRFLAANPGVQPTRFQVGSLGDGLPKRDLLVSPEHAMFLDGLLIPARCLVNGRTITQERGLDWVDYFHVELDSHDVLLAEGAPSESYLDDDSRGTFHNATEFVRLYPDAASAGGFCAPKVTEGYELEAIRQQLAMVPGEIAQAA